MLLIWEMLQIPVSKDKTNMEKKNIKEAWKSRQDKAVQNSRWNMLTHSTETLTMPKEPEEIGN